MTVLVAEDDPRTREALCTVLENEGYRVHAATDGAHALTVFRTVHPDLVLLDIMMPRMNGYDVCRAIRTENTDVPVLFLSAKSEEVDKVVGLELGGDDYIAKPFGVRELVARIRAVTRRTLGRRGQTDATAPFEFGPHTVSPIDLSAVRPGATVELSLREVAILRALAEHPGVPVTRAQLYHRCWGEDQPLQSRTLDQHMSRLRRRIEPDPATPTLIQTVHGVGYRYCPQLA